MDVLVTAGGIPNPGDPLYEYTQGGNKVLFELAGKPILQWVLDAINVSENTGSILIVGMPETRAVSSKKPTFFLEAKGSLLENIEAGIGELLVINPNSEYALLISGDLPAINGDMIDWLIDRSVEQVGDFFYPIIEQRIMEATFKDAQRTYVSVGEKRYCGGDMMVLRTSLLNKEKHRWKQLVDSRKNPLRQAMILGLDLSFRLIAGKLSLDRDVPIASRRLGFDIRVLECPFAETGMDIDKPHHIEIMKKFIESRKC